MILLGRHAASMTVSFLRFVWSSGRWWIGMLMPALMLAGVILVVAKTAVPTIVYAFF